MLTLCVVRTQARYPCQTSIILSWPYFTVFFNSTSPPSISQVKEDWDFQPSMDENSQGSVKSEAPSEAPSEPAAEPEVLSLADRMRLKSELL